MEPKPTTEPVSGGEPQARFRKHQRVSFEFRGAGTVLQVTHNKVGIVYEDEGGEHRLIYLPQSAVMPMGRR
jgi:hypothetical protein